MLKKLNAQQVQHFRDYGYVSGVPVLSSERAREYRRRLEETEKAFGPIRQDKKSTRSHLLYTWASKLVREPALLDAVEDLIGPDILIFSLTVFPKEPKDSAFVSWHQDSTYHALEPPDQVSAWVALSDASIQAGCMEVIPGTHRLGQLGHKEEASPHNLLSRGQTVSGLPKTDSTDFMPLKPGEVSLHHSYLIHRSGPNNSNDRRIGVSISYIPTYCRCTSDVRLTATLVRGEDRFGHFDLEPTPNSDYDDRAREFHRLALARYAEMRARIRF